MSTNSILIALRQDRGTSTMLLGQLSSGRLLSALLQLLGAHSSVNSALNFKCSDKSHRQPSMCLLDSSLRRTFHNNNPCYSVAPPLRAPIYLRSTYKRKSSLENPRKEKKLCQRQSLLFVPDPYCPSTSLPRREVEVERKNSWCHD